jgi:hypothetical protein
MTMIRRALLGLFTLPLLALAGSSAHATSIGLQLSATSLAVGSTLEVRIVGSGFPDGVDGGDLSLAWTGSLEYVSIAIPDPPWDTSAYDDSTAASGYLDFIDVFAFFETPGLGGAEFDIATVTLRAIAVGEAFVGASPADVGWSLGGETIADVSYEVPDAIDVRPIPAPGSSALLAPFLGLLAWSRRRDTRP